jgi:hypothetical protein
MGDYVDWAGMRNFDGEVGIALRTQERHKLGSIGVVVKVRMQTLFQISLIHVATVFEVAEYWRYFY